MGTKGHTWGPAGTFALPALLPLPQTDMVRVCPACHGSFLFHPSPFVQGTGLAGWHGEISQPLALPGPAASHCLQSQIIPRPV